MILSLQEVTQMPKPHLYAEKTFSKQINSSSFNLHSHENYEIYCFLKGNAKYLIEGNTYSLKPGDILIIRKGEAHRLILNKDNIPYERIIINFNTDAILGNTADKFLKFIESKEIGKHNCYHSSDLNEGNILYFLEKMCNSKDLNQKCLYLTVFLEEICENPPQLNEHEAVEDNISLIIDYINHHLNDNITLDDICARFYISKAHLIRKFKAVTGVTVWNYIRTKRLNFARELLKSGGHPTDIFETCGFNDYCSFFKAYKSYFGVSPKKDYKKQ